MIRQKLRRKEGWRERERSLAAVNFLCESICHDPEAIIELPNE